MTTSILSVRVSETERNLLETAAKYAHTSLSDFVRRKAMESAEIEMMGRVVVEISAKHWQDFEAWLNTPPQTIPALQRIAGMKPAWE